MFQNEHYIAYHLSLVYQKGAYSIKELHLLPKARDFSVELSW